MSRTAFVVILLFTALAGVFAQTEQQDYTSQMLKLTTLTDNKPYREAIEGYRLLEAQPGTPGWLKAACEYEVAELYAALQETAQTLAGLKIAEADYREPRLVEGGGAACAT